MIEEEPLPTTIVYYGGFLLLIIFIITIIGNAWSIISFSIYTRLHQSLFNVFLVNFAICGFLIGIIYVPIYGIFLTKDWPNWKYGYDVCNVVSYVKENSMSVMALTLMLMSIHIYIIIMKRKQMPRNIICLMLVLFWSMSSFLHAIYNFKPETHHNATINICGKISLIDLDEDQKSNVTINLFLNLIPSTLAVLILLRPSYITMQFISQTNTANLQESKKKRIVDVKVTIILTVLYICFCMPYWLISIIESKKDKTNVKIIVMSNVISLLSCGMLPIVCAMFSKYLRKIYFDMICGCKGSIFCERKQKSSAEEHLTVSELDCLDGSDPVFLKGKFNLSNNNKLSISIETIDLMSPNHRAAQENSSIRYEEDLMRDTEF